MGWGDLKIRAFAHVIFCFRAERELRKQGRKMNLPRRLCSTSLACAVFSHGLNVRMRIYVCVFPLSLFPLPVIIDSIMLVVGVFISVYVFVSCGFYGFMWFYVVCFVFVIW